MNFKSIVLGFLAGPLLASIVSSANGYLATLFIPSILANLSSGMNWISAYFTLSSFFIHALFALLGGYIAGKVAEQNEYWHAGAVAIVGIIANIGLSFWLSQHFNSPTMGVGNVIRLALTTIPYALVGAYLARVKSMRKLATN